MASSLCSTLRFIALCACALAAAAPPAAAPATATVTVSGVLRVVDPAFLGVNIDSASLTNNLDLSDPYLSTLAAQLAAAGGAGAPAMHLRVGGSASNGLVYLPTGTPGRGAGGSTVVTDASLTALDAFARRAGLRITFCIPYQTEPSGAWSPSINASALWASARARNWTAFDGWSLGNEILGGMSPAARAQYGADYAAFRAAVSAQAPAWAQRIVGPSAAGFPAPPAIADWLAATAALPQLSLSLHAYAFKNCSLAAYTSKAGIERMSVYFSEFAAARDAAAPAMPLYLEEFAAQAGGGCDGLSNRFASGFWFVHSLGLAGAGAIARVTRQDLAGWSFASGASRYTLAGPPGWRSSAADGLPTPHPDYFLAILWRQLMGTAVLNVTLSALAPATDDRLAVHAWCAAPAARAPAGALALAYIWLGNAPLALALAALADAPRDEFVLTAPGGNLTADALLLNGAPLAVDGAGRLPALPLPGAHVPTGGAPLTLPPLSFGFVLLPAAAAAACM